MDGFGDLSSRRMDPDRFLDTSSIDEEGLVRARELKSTNSITNDRQGGEAGGT